MVISVKIKLIIKEGKTAGYGHEDKYREVAEVIRSNHLKWIFTSSKNFNNEASARRLPITYRACIFFRIFISSIDDFLRLALHLIERLTEVRAM